MSARWLKPQVNADVNLEKALKTAIDLRLEQEDVELEKQHASTRLWPAGRLSASRLANPLQWQALYTLGYRGRVIDPYARRLFLRGRQCEDWFIAEIKRQNAGFSGEQVPVEYREVVGFADLVVAHGEMPWEIKSVANRKFAWIKKQGPDRSHLYQACLYALALHKPAFGIIYIASDDFRILPYTIATSQIADDVEHVIDRFQSWRVNCQTKGDHVPLFVAEENWHSNPKYNSYADWMDLDDQGLAAKLCAERSSW